MSFGAKLEFNPMSEQATPSPPSADFIAHVTRSQRVLHSFILSLVWSASDADDVLQETNLVLWRKAAEFDPAREFLPWAMRFAQFQALAYLKRRQRSKLAFDDALLDQLATEAIAETAETDARRAALSSCLEKLPADHRRLLAGRYEPAGSVNALAAARGTTPKALSELLRRIRQALLLCIERTLARDARA
jgi:RNA polymerase sigma-70 factor (ECF subfamily)